MAFFESQRFQRLNVNKRKGGKTVERRADRRITRMRLRNDVQRSNIDLRNPLIPGSAWVRALVLGEFPFWIKRLV